MLFEESRLSFDDKNLFIQSFKIWNNLEILQNELEVIVSSLPNVALDPAIRATTDVIEAARGVDAILLTAPSQFLRDAISNLKNGINFLMKLIFQVL